MQAFDDIRADGLAYVDKTHFIEVLENRCGRFPFIIRPRRFGKSTFATDKPLRKIAVLFVGADSTRCEVVGP